MATLREENEQNKVSQEVLRTGTNYGANREKYWKELSIEEKIERLRTLVKSLVSQCDRQEREASELRSFIWEHSHEENGEVIVKVSKKESYKLLRPDRDFIGQIRKEDSDESFI